MKRWIVTVVILLLLPSVVHATAQQPDRIEVDGKVFYLQTNPLESYLKSIEWEVPEQAIISSANWRGYLASWRLESGYLVLADVSIEVEDETKARRTKRVSYLNELFPEQSHIQAKWYSGALVIAYGELVNYVHMGYGSTFEKYQIISVREGEIIDHLFLTLAEFEAYREEKFKAFQQTELYKEQFIELTEGEHDWTEEKANGFLFSYYAEKYLSQ
ncbi:hypothetical protein [Pseudidiomarina sp.]|uniref:hypothetical protein n=1 Tax=Pseudidiomarina sp. TaxID=2081707 RepID=UPI003A96BABF